MNSSKQAQRAVIQFLSAEGVSGTDIYSRMKNVYGTECMSRTAIFSLFIPAVLKAHLSITLMYINSQNTAVHSSISYYSFCYFIVVSFRRHVSAHSFGPSSGLTNILESTTVCNAYIPTLPRRDTGKTHTTKTTTQQE